VIKLIMVWTYLVVIKIIWLKQKHGRLKLKTTAETEKRKERVEKAIRYYNGVKRAFDINIRY
jgi:hypothetical protein